MAELAAALSPAVTLPQDDLWDWLITENPLFAKICTLFEPPPGGRLLPEESTPGVFSTGFSLRCTGETPMPPEVADRLELLLTDLTFGCEELAGYSEPIQQVEEPPLLLMHPEDAAKLGLSAGDRVALRLPGGELPVALQTAANMAPGVILLPRHRQLNWRLAPDYRVMMASGDIVKVEES